MLSMHNLWVIARYEMKTLLRSWFFRIFSGLALFMLFWMDFAFLTIGEVPWALRALPSTVPYMNLILLNTVQAVIAVFLASDFLKRDKKLDTTEVIYMRNMSNGDYVFGKTLGIVLVFMALNLAMLLIALLFNIISSDVSVSLPTYLYYLLIISLPTLLFILGFSFLLMVVIGNQAVTFIVLLGYIALTLFFLGKKMDHVFDYMGFYLPLLYSDLSGFGDLGKIVLQRGIYATAGLGGIAMTVRSLKRLPQSKWVTRGATVVAVLCLAGSLAMGYVYVQQNTGDGLYRRQMLATAEASAAAPEATMTAMRLNVTHTGSTISAEAAFTLCNATAAAMDSLVMQLNPGLTVASATVNEEAIEHSQRDHLLVLHRRLAVSETAKIKLRYAGGIDERVAHLDAPEVYREKAFRVWLYRMEKRHAFLQPDYALLTPEVLWYPVPGPGYSRARPWPKKRDFINFDLTATPRPGHLAIAQGSTADSIGTFHFVPDTPLPSLTLAMGPYKKQSITVDSLTYNLVTCRSHNYWAPHFDQMADTLGAVIRELRQDYENQIELNYPFKRLSIVEAPIHFVSYPHLWEGHQATVQPEMVLFPENGMGIEWADFKQMARRMKRRSRYTNEVVTAEESQTQIFQRFIMNTFVSKQASRRVDDEEEATIAQSYTLTPNFFSYVTALNAPAWPLLDAALEAYIGGRVERPVSGFRRAFMGPTDEEKVNQSLRGRSLLDYLSNPDDPELAPRAIQNKGKMLFTLMESRLGESEFDALMSMLCQGHPYGPVPVDAVLAFLEEKHGLDFAEMLAQWHEGTQLPAYRFTRFQGYLVRDGNHERTQIRFTVENMAAVDGMIKVSIRMGGGPGRRGMGGRRGGFGGAASENEEWLISMPGHTVKEFGLLLDGQPRSINIETQVAENLPQNLSKTFEKYELNRRAVPFEGERLLTVFPNPEPTALIVDNEDAGFRISQEDRRSPLKKWLNIKSKARERYSGINFWRPPGFWQGITHAEFHGDRVKSAMYTRNGDGSKRAVWTTALPGPGDYDIWTYYTSVRPPWRRRREAAKGRYRYSIFHEEGVDETLLDVHTAAEGWNFLGTFYLTGDSARVALSNESESKMVVADAVKWIKR